MPPASSPLVRTGIPTPSFFVFQLSADFSGFFCVLLQTFVQPYCVWSLQRDEKAWNSPCYISHKDVAARLGVPRLQGLDAVAGDAHHLFVAAFAAQLTQQGGVLQTFGGGQTQRGVGAFQAVAAAQGPGDLQVTVKVSGSRICRLRALLDTTSSIAPPAAGIVSGSPLALTATGGLYPVWLGGTE